MKRRIFSLFMVVIMVCALAVGCGGKKDEDVQENQKKTEASDDKKKEEGVAPEEPAGAETSEESEEVTPKTENDTLSEEDIAALKASIRDTVMKEYVGPNGITVDQIVWPENWEDFSIMVNQYAVCLDLGSEFELETEKSSTDILVAVFLGILNWLDEQGEYTLGYFSNTMAVLEPRKETIIMAVTE